MPIFAFLKQFSKIHDEITAKTRFWHVEYVRILFMPIFAFLEKISKVDDENSAKTRFFGMLNICEYCVCLYLRF